VALAQLLKEQNFPAIDIHRAMNQEERLSRYQLFKVGSFCIVKCLFTSRSVMFESATTVLEEVVKT